MSYKNKWNSKEYINKNYNNTEKINYRKRKHIVLEENKCKYIGINKSLKEFYTYKVDGDLIPSNTKLERCDFLLICTSDNKTYFIELKGKDISKAFKQIIATLENKDITSELENPKYYARIVLKRCPPNIENQKDIRKYKKALKEKYKCDIKISNSPLEEDI